MFSVNLKFKTSSERYHDSITCHKYIFSLRYLNFQQNITFCGIIIIDNEMMKLSYQLIINFLLLIFFYLKISRNILRQHFYISQIITVYNIRANNTQCRHPPNIVQHLLIDAIIQARTHFHNLQLIVT